MEISSREKALLQDLKKNVESDPGGNFSIQRISSELSIDRTKLCTGFKKLFSISIHQFVMVCRIQKAKQLLKQSELPIKALAKECGYKNVKNFHTAFKKQIGKTPLRYRRGTN